MIYRCPFCGEAPFEVLSPEDRVAKDEYFATHYCEDMKELGFKAPAKVVETLKRRNRQIRDLRRQARK